MALSAEFKDAVSQKKTTRVRIMLKDSLLLDLDGEAFSQMLEYARRQMPLLMDEHDGEVFKPEESWNEDYFNEQMVIVVNNFSSERIELLKNMVRKLYQRPEGKKVNVEGTHSDSTCQSSDTGLSIMQKSGIAVVVAGAVVIIGGVVAEVPVAVPVIGGVALAAGGALIVAGRKNDY